MAVEPCERCVADPSGWQHLCLFIQELEDTQDEHLALERLDLR